MSKISGENLLIPHGTQVLDLNGIITLNDTALYVWELLQDDLSEQDIIEKIVNEFDVDVNTASNDLSVLLNKFKSLDLLN